MCAPCSDRVLAASLDPVGLTRWEEVPLCQIPILGVPPAANRCVGSHQGCGDGRGVVRSRLTGAVRDEIIVASMSIAELAVAWIAYASLASPSPSGGCSEHQPPAVPRGRIPPGDDKVLHTLQYFIDGGGVDVAPLLVCIFDPPHEVIISDVEAVKEDPALHLGVCLLAQSVCLI